MRRALAGLLLSTPGAALRTQRGPPVAPPSSRASLLSRSASHPDAPRATADAGQEVRQERQVERRWYISKRVSVLSVCASCGQFILPPSYEQPRALELPLKARQRELAIHSVVGREEGENDRVVPALCRHEPLLARPKARVVRLGLLSQLVGPCPACWKRQVHIEQGARVRPALDHLQFAAVESPRGGGLPGAAMMRTPTRSYICGKAAASA